MYPLGDAAQPSHSEGDPLKKATTIEIDFTKRVFQVGAVPEEGRPVLSKKIS